MTTKTIQTFVNDTTTDKSESTKGVPQRSVLGALFYLLHIDNVEKIGLLGTKQKDNLLRLTVLTLNNHDMIFRVKIHQ